MLANTAAGRILTPVATFGLVLGGIGIAGIVVFDLVLGRTHVRVPVIFRDVLQWAVAFFALLRAELRKQLGQSPCLVRFTGLRNCVKQLAGARRWTGSCQRLNDRIVEYLRGCLSAERSARKCSLLVK